MVTIDSMDAIGIALENAPLTTDLNTLTKSIRRVQSVGFCLEDYMTIENAYPGIFDDINPKMLTTNPSSTKQSVALELMNNNVGAMAAIAGGAALIVGLFYKLVRWMVERFGGGGSAGGGGTSVVEVRKCPPDVIETKIIDTQEIADLTGKDLVSKVMNNVTLGDGWFKTMAEMEEERLVEWKLKPEGMICYRRIKEVLGSDVVNIKKVAQAIYSGVFANHPTFAYAITNRSGIPATAFILDTSNFKNIKYSQLPFVATNIVTAIECADEFVADNDDKKLKNFIRAVERVEKAVKGLGFDNNAQRDLGDNSGKRFSAYARTTSEFKYHENFNNFRIDLPSPDDTKQSLRAKDVATMRQILVSKLSGITELGKTEIENKQQQSEFRSGLNQIRSSISTITSLEKAVTEETSARLKMCDEYTNKVSMMTGGIAK